MIRVVVYLRELADADQRVQVDQRHRQEDNQDLECFEQQWELCFEVHSYFINVVASEAKQSHGTT